MRGKKWKFHIVINQLNEGNLNKIHSRKTQQVSLNTRAFGNRDVSDDGFVCNHKRLGRDRLVNSVPLRNSIVWQIFICDGYCCFCVGKLKMAENIDFGDLLLLALVEGDINEEEYILLTEEDDIEFKQSNFPYHVYEKCNWNIMDELVCRTEFRYKKEDIPRLQAVLRIPEEIFVKRCNSSTGLEALCILLKRFAFPVRYCDMVPFLGRSVPEMFRILHFMTNFILKMQNARLGGNYAENRMYMR